MSTRKCLAYEPCVAAQHDDADSNHDEDKRPFCISQSYRNDKHRNDEHSKPMFIADIESEPLRDIFDSQLKTKSLERFPAKKKQKKMSRSKAVSNETLLKRPICKKLAQSAQNVVPKAYSAEWDRDFQITSHTLLEEGVNAHSPSYHTKEVKKLKHVGSIDDGTGYVRVDEGYFCASL